MGEDTGSQFAQGHPEWRVEDGKLVAVYATGSFSAGAEFVARMARLADDLNHHPDVELTYPRVTVRTISHDVGHLTARDEELAAGISQLAESMGIPLHRAG